MQYNEELNKLIPHLILGTGVLPNIHAKLLPKWGGAKCNKIEWCEGAAGCYKHKNVKNQNNT